MFSLIITPANAAVPAAVLAAQNLLDQTHAAISVEAAKVAAALSCMKFSDYAVDGPMLTGYFADDEAE